MTSEEIAIVIAKALKKSSRKLAIAPERPIDFGERQQHDDGLVKDVERVDQPPYPLQHPALAATNRARRTEQRNRPGEASQGVCAPEPHVAR